MRLVLFSLIAVCLWQTALAFTPGKYSPSKFKQERHVGLQVKRDLSSFRNTLIANYFFSDSVSAEELYNQGKRDAKPFYKNRKDFWIPFGVTIGSLLAAPILHLPGLGTGLYFLPGLGTSLSTGFIKPQENNLKHRDIRYRNMKLIESVDQLFQDSSYVEGYRKGAQQRKLGKAIGGFGAGVGVAVLFAIGLAVAVMSGT